MAYMSQEKKKEIKAELKKIMPQDWKWSLSVLHRSTLVLTVQKSPVDLIGEACQNWIEKYRDKFDAVQVRPNSANVQHLSAETNMEINHYLVADYFGGERLELFQKIVAALNDGNWDKSDSQTDYSNVGWYVSIKLGRHSKPFIVAG